MDRRKRSSISRRPSSARNLISIKMRSSSTNGPTTTTSAKVTGQMETTTERTGTSSSKKHKRRWSFSLAPTALLTEAPSFWVFSSRRHAPSTHRMESTRPSTTETRFPTPRNRSSATSASHARSPVSSNTRTTMISRTKTISPKLAPSSTSRQESARKTLADPSPTTRTTTAAPSSSLCLNPSTRSCRPHPRLPRRSLRASSPSPPSLLLP
mmetsp:Transcript_18995/g.44497  ORF Transcript_18995/g.44497 Transcript_18995/m.44497 type:complete len:211 (-) Transcript_18995:214-846(-)